MRVGEIEMVHWHGVLRMLHHPNINWLKICASQHAVYLIGIPDNKPSWLLTPHGFPLDNIYLFIISVVLQDQGG